MMWDGAASWRTKLMSLVGSEGGAYANAKRHRERCDLISGYPIARCVVVRSKASAPYPLQAA